MSIKTIPNLGKKLAVSRQLTRASFALLLVVLLVSGLVSKMAYPLLAFTLVPLLIFIPGLVRENYRSLSLLCFVVLMYFIVNVVNLQSPGSSLYDWVELALLVTLFHAAMMYSRWKQYSLYQDD